MFLCIFCRQRKDTKYAHIAEKYLGVCDLCNEKLSRVPQGAMFCGGGDIDTLFAPFYYNGKIKAAVRRYKFAAQPRYAKIFSELLYEYLKPFELYKDFDLITAVPLSKKRLYERGFCQTELIARPLSKLLGIRYEPNCLIKPIHNAAQSGMSSRTVRTENVRNVYLADKYKVKDRSIILFDDVFTTGATMRSCALELARCGASNISGIAFAKAQRVSDEMKIFDTRI